ncbi:MAG: hypothetical protein ACFFBU_09480 [Promethearchaeota archaeon]
MVRKCKVVQCPECNEFTYVPMGIHRNFCPRCNAKVPLHDLDGQIVNSSREAQQLVQISQYALHNVEQPPNLNITQSPAKQLLQILRCHRSAYPQWLPIHEVYQRGIEVGLHPKEIQEAIELLRIEGFLEKREDTVRVMPLN